MFSRIILKIIRGYQLFLSPFLGRSCRFEPTCSEYCCLALQKYGLLKGAWLTFRRVARCNPYSVGGADEP